MTVGLDALKNLRLKPRYHTLIFSQLHTIVRNALAVFMAEDKPKPDPEDIRALYAALVSKRVNYEVMLWQVPIISLTAQAFLLQIAFGDTTHYRIISGLAAAIISLASWQLMIRHGAMERQTSEKLEIIENKYLIQKDLTQEEREELRVHCEPKLKGGYFADTQSKPIWRICILFIGSIGVLPLLEWGVLYFSLLAHLLQWLTHREHSPATLAFLMWLGVWGVYLWLVIIKMIRSKASAKARPK